MPSDYKAPVCKGSWALGTACGKCERCLEHPLAQMVVLDEEIEDANPGWMTGSANQPTIEQRHRDERLEAIAKALSIPEHHTGWDLLTFEQQDLYRSQAFYAAAAMREYDAQHLDELRREIFEECAKIAEAETGVYPHGNQMFGSAVPGKIAAAIRARADLGRVG